MKLKALSIKKSIKSLNNKLTKINYFVMMKLKIYCIKNTQSINVNLNLKKLKVRSPSLVLVYSRRSKIFMLNNFHQKSQCLIKMMMMLITRPQLFMLHSPQTSLEIKLNSFIKLLQRNYKMMIFKRQMHLKMKRLQKQIYLKLV